MAEGERFVDNGDGTVTDTKYKLMWLKMDSYQKEANGAVGKEPTNSSPG